MAAASDRQQYRETVAVVAAKARALLPAAVNGRIESAVKLVLAGDVEVLTDGSVTVGSSDPTRVYHLVGPTCTCTDFTQGKAPEGWCKHRISAGIDKRVREVLAALPAPTLAPPAAALPEAPASANCHVMLEGRQVQITLRDTDETRLLQRLTALLQQYPVAQPATPPTEEKEGWCKQHGAQMTLNQKQGRTWYSHKTDQGWCKGR
jgi:hypothetical protein